MMAYLKLISAVKASDGSDKRNLVKPTDLDIYWEPPVSPAIDAPPKYAALHSQVSRVRRYLWQFSGIFLNAFNKTRHGVNAVTETVDNAYQTASKDPVKLIRPGCIATAFAAGTLIPGRGNKKLLRLISATGAGTVVAAVSYPKCAASVSVNAFNKSKDLGFSLVSYMKEKSEGQKSVAIITEESSDHAAAENETVKENPEVSTEATNLNKGQEGDVVEKIEANDSEVIKDLEKPSSVPESQSEIRSDEGEVVKEISQATEESTASDAGHQQDSPVKIEANDSEITNEPLSIADTTLDSSSEKLDEKSTEVTVIVESPLDEDVKEVIVEKIENSSNESEMVAIMTKIVDANADSEVAILQPTVSKESAVSTNQEQDGVEKGDIKEVTEPQVDALDDETHQEKAKDVGKVEQAEIQVSSNAEGATISSEVNERNAEEQPLNEVPVDYGQSVPEDKDMYSTRQ